MAVTVEDSEDVDEELLGLGVLRVRPRPSFDSKLAEVVRHIFSVAEDDARLIKKPADGVDCCGRKAVEPDEGVA